jgi:predicted ATPase
MLIERLRLKNILSFRDTTIELGRLNVLIGPNGVGKSNLIEVVGLLQAAPTELAPVILRGGGIRQWLWLGDDLPATASIECSLKLRDGRHAGPVSYDLQILGDNNNSYAITQESLTDSFSLSRGEAKLYAQGPANPPTVMGFLGNESLLSQFKSPGDPTLTTTVGREFRGIQIFREFRTGPGTAVRQGISTNMAKDRLQDGGDNLAMVLQDLNFQDRDDWVDHYLKRFCERFAGAKVDIGGGLARIYLSETGLKDKISSARMSDGTLKFLALLAALLHPKPPPLMCIEEPELGLHPDALQMVAEVLVEASQSTQLIVTTHSEALVDALTDHPESVLVCERDFDNGTQMKRVPKKKLKLWLERYKLGELWRKGEIGGSRW